MYLYFQLSEPRSPGSVESDLFSEELADEKDTDNTTSETLTIAGLKFGWIQGVLVCNLCYTVFVFSDAHAPKSAKSAV